MLIAVAPAAAIGLQELVAGLEDVRFDARDAAAFAEAAPLLAGLGANRAFLADLLIAELEAGARGQVASSGYGAQVVMLHRGRDWFVRANVWPAARDAVLRTSGAASFFYGVPHDHNFHFLTVGYAGPGYASDYWEADPEMPDAAPRFAGRRRLGPGEVMLYRAHRDIHDQHPPAALSVTLNIVQATADVPFRSQYRYEPGTGRRLATLAYEPVDALLPLVAALGGAEGRALLVHHAKRHPCERIRIGAGRALASVAEEDRLASRIGGPSV